MSIEILLDLDFWSSSMVTMPRWLYADCMAGIFFNCLCVDYCLWQIFHESAVCTSCHDLFHHP